MKRLWLHRHALALSLVLSFTVALPAHAQDDAGRASREREALRRAQSALKQSQEQQATLTREKSDIAAERDKLGDSAKRAESQLGASRATVARAGTELARVGIIYFTQCINNPESEISIRMIKQLLQKIEQIISFICLKLNIKVWL